jgi:ADP-heptose:LPS heptosyltransferase
MTPGTIIISRTDSIGDVVLTCPVAGFLKEKFPGCRIIFLGQSYTKPIISACDYVDDFIDWSMLKREEEKNRVKIIKETGADAIVHVFPVKDIAVMAYKARIPVRIGTTGRLYHLTTCNRLVPLSRRHSSLHESQLNLKLLRPFDITSCFSLPEIGEHYGLSVKENLPDHFKNLFSGDKFNLILHSLSKGSSREWGLDNYRKLIEILPNDLFTIFITGTEDEGVRIKDMLNGNRPHVTDLTGKLTLTGLISLIGASDGMVAASTGPLHIAAALGKYAIGLYPPIKPLHPGRWAPVGKHTSYIVKNQKCNSCRHKIRCQCIENIQPEEVKQHLMKIINQ